MSNNIDIRARRETLGLSQEAVAARVGLHVRNYSIYERRWPCALRPELVERLAAVLEVDPKSLVDAGGAS